MVKKIGIIGFTGRMGKLLADKIEKHAHFLIGPGYSQSKSHQTSLEDVFLANDYVIDFSKHHLLASILETAIKIPKPIVICTTGWYQKDYQNLITQASKKVPLVIAPNTSVGAYLQKRLVSELAKILNADYDIDIHDKHHRHKIDIPSGTAQDLIHEIQKAKKSHQGLDYEASILEKGPRPNNFIGISVERSGNIPGDHEVTFTSIDELISIKHVAFDRSIFAQGAVRILEWLEKSEPGPGIYTMADIFAFCL